MVSVPTPVTYPHIALESFSGYLTDDGDPIVRLGQAVNWLIANHRPPLIAVCPEPESGTTLSYVLPAVPSADGLSYEFYLGLRAMTANATTASVAVSWSVGEQPGGTWTAIDGDTVVIPGSDYIFERLAIGIIDPTATHLLVEITADYAVQADMILVLPEVRSYPIEAPATLDAPVTATTGFQAGAWDLVITETITLTAVRFASIITSSPTMRFYTRPGTAAGYTSSISGWSLRQSKVVSTTAGAMATMTLDTPITLTPGTYGCYLTCSTTTSVIRYISFGGGPHATLTDPRATITCVSVNAANFGTTYSNYDVEVGVAYTYPSESPDLDPGVPASGAIPFCLADYDTTGPNHPELLNRLWATARAVMRDRRQAVWGWCRSVGATTVTKLGPGRPWAVYAQAQAVLRGQAGATVTARVGGKTASATVKVQVGQQNGGAASFDLTSTASYDYLSETFEVTREKPDIYMALGNQANVDLLYCCVDWRPGD